jgi:hypothetical protein
MKAFSFGPPKMDHGHHVHNLNFSVDYIVRSVFMCPVAALKFEL